VIFLAASRSCRDATKGFKGRRSSTLIRFRTSHHLKELVVQCVDVIKPDVLENWKRSVYISISVQGANIEDIIHILNYVCNLTFESPCITLYVSSK